MFFCFLLFTSLCPVIAVESETILPEFFYCILYVLQSFWKYINKFQLQKRMHDGTEPTLLEVADQQHMYKLVDCIKRQVSIVAIVDNLFSL